MKTKKIISVLLAIIMTLGLSTVFVTAADTVTPDYSIANMNNAPTMDGSPYYSEYGAPIITATQATNTGKIKWTQGGGDISDAQKAYVYMAANEDYLYVAAKLDNAKKYGTSITSGVVHPQLCVTVSGYAQNDHNVTLKDGDEHFRAFRVYFDPSGAVKTYSKVIKGTSVDNSYSTSETNKITYAAKFENNTYTYEMRIDWDTVPGMSGQDYKNGKPFAMTIRINDGTDNASKPCYYQIGGKAAGNLMANAHGDGVITVAGGEWCYQYSELAKMPDETPNVMNPYTEGEYGDPILVTSPQHVYTIANSSYYKKTGDMPGAQRAKVYMTNDENYLYIAGTLDHAKANGSAISKAGQGAQMLVTLSRYDETTDNKIHQVNGCDNYLLARFGFTADSASGVPYLKIYTDTADGKGTTNTDPVGLTVTGAYNENVYTYEMCIPWSQIPGMEDGVYNGESLAATIRFLDGCDSAYDNHYNIGGDAGASITQANIHDGGVLKLTVNDQSTKAVAQVGTTNYGSLDRAVNAAQSGDTITLRDDASVDTIEVPNGVTLDLNGYVLTANTITASAPQTMVLDSKDGVGGIKIAKNDENATNLTLNPRNLQLPLYDAEFEGYRFFNCTLEHRDRWKVENKKYQFGYVLKMSDVAFDLLKDSDEDNNLDADIKLIYTISLTVDDVKVLNEVYTFSTKLMTEATSNASPTLGVTGFDQVKDQVIVLTSSNPKIESSTGVNIVPEVAELALTYSNAQ